MEGATSNTTENVQPDANVIKDASGENLPPSDNQSCFLQQDDDYIKTSEPVAEEIEAVVNEGNWTVKRLLKAVENTTSSNLNLVDQNTTTIHTSSIVDMDSVTTSNDVRPFVASPTDQLESQMNAAVTDNCQQQLQKRKHIMISYNHASASTVCQKIYDRLVERNYNVWFDTKHLKYGSILKAMGEAIDDSYVVLVCMNEAYSKSYYCLIEAKYAIESKIPVIPCMMEQKFRPRGLLGIIKSDLKHIEFFDEEKFDESFEELISEIDTIQTGSGMRSTLITDMDFRDRFNAIINEHIASINNCRLRRENLGETEFGTVLRRLIEEFCPETLQSFQNGQSDESEGRQIQERGNDHIIQHLLENDKRLEELIRIQEETYAGIQQHLVDHDERLVAFMHFQKEQERARLNQNENLMSLFRTEEMRQQSQERNDRIVGQLLQRIEQLTEFVVRQQQLQATDTESVRRLVNRSLENNELLRSANDQDGTPPVRQQQQQQQQGFHITLNTFKDLIQSTVLLCTLFILLKNR